MTERAIVPSESRRQRLVGAALSAVALALIVVAVPVALYKLGGIPSFHIDVGQTAKEISHHPDGQHLISRWLMRAALVLAWVSWVWMTICVALEIRSRFTGRISTRLPASRSVQSLAAFLVGTALAISAIGRVAAVPRIDGTRTASIARPGSTVPYAEVEEVLLPLRVIDEQVEMGRRQQLEGGSGSGSPSPSLVARLDVETSSGEHTSRGRGLPSLRGSVVAPLEAHRSSRPPDGIRSSGTVHLVAPHETLWSIAGERLGNPLRWKEIAVLNYEVRQGDGGALTVEHWILPGWILELPGSKETQDYPKGDQPGRRLLSSSYLGPASRHDQVTDEAAGHERTVDTQPDLSSRPSGPNGASVNHSPLVPFHEPRVPMMPVGGGVVGVGVVGLLDRMRRVQQRYRSEGAYIRLPGRTQSQFEHRLRLGEGREIVHAVDAVLRLLGQAWRDLACDPPSVMGITVHPDSIELFVDRIEGCETLPLQFRPDSGRRSVSVERALLPAPESGDAGSGRTSSPAPLLVTAGHGSDGLVMLNLESLGTLLVNGNPTGCEGIVRALALELATSHWAGCFDLNVVGFGAELERFERVVAVPDVRVLLDRLNRRRLEAEARLRETGFESFAQARCAARSERWDPLAVLCSPAVTEDDIAELSDLASDPRLGIAVVAPGAVAGAPHTLSVADSDRTSTLELLGSVLLPQEIGVHDLDEVTALVDTAMNRRAVPLSEEPYVSLPVTMPIMTPASTRTPEEDASGPDQARGGQPIQHFATHEVEVAVLGQIEIVGAAREFTRAWSKELVVYLAMHPNGASNEAWATALWPDRLMAPSSLHSTASVARRALGQARNGADHLPRSHGRLVLSDTVGTDWDRFVVHADANDPAKWRTALELVRGRPFEGLRSSDWPILEGIGPAIEGAVVDLSGRLAGSCLAVGDARGAEWAARRGLLVSPYDERLYRMLMRAADVAGNPAGVEAVMSELIRLVANEIEPLDSVHPSTMDLYRSLTRRRNGTSRIA